MPFPAIQEVSGFRPRKWACPSASAAQTFYPLCKHDSIPPAVQGELRLQTYHTTFIFLC